METLRTSDVFDARYDSTMLLDNSLFVHMEERTAITRVNFTRTSKVKDGSNLSAVFIFFEDARYERFPGSVDKRAKIFPGSLFTSSAKLKYCSQLLSNINVLAGPFLPKVYLSFHFAPFDQTEHVSYTTNIPYNY